MGVGVLTENSVFDKGFVRGIRWARRSNMGILNSTESALNLLVSEKNFNFEEEAHQCQNYRSGGRGARHHARVAAGRSVKSKEMSGIIYAERFDEIA